MIEAGGSQTFYLARSKCGHFSAVSGFDIFICLLTFEVPNLSAVSVFNWIQGIMANPGGQDGLLGQVRVLAHFGVCLHLIEGYNSGEIFFKSNQIFRVISLVPEE